MHLPKKENLERTKFNELVKNTKFVRILVAGLIFSILTLTFLPISASIITNNTKEIKLERLNISGRKISLEEDNPVFKATDEVKFSLKVNKDTTFSGRVSSFISSATTVFGSEDAVLTAEVFNGKGGLVDSFDLDYDGSPEINIDSAKLTPGKYILRVFDPDNPNRFIEQDFTWGVLAINTNKSVYKEGETVKLAIAVLDEEGNMVCDALLRLNIQASEGQASTFSTENGTIKVSEWCTKKEYTLIPDYETTFDVAKPGTYEMILTAETKNGSYTITDMFEVASTQEEGPLSPTTDHRTLTTGQYFDIERISATRIFPESAYPMMFAVTATEDFKGTVTETVPASFKVTGLSLYELDEYFGHSNFEDDGVTVPLKITEKDDKKILEWQVDWKKGQVYHLHYKYQTPNKSPEFYTVGPLTIISADADNEQINTDLCKSAPDQCGSIVFKELRTWSLAIDVATTMILLWDSNNGTIPAGWTCISCSGGAYENVYPRGGSSYTGTTGGAANHDHTTAYVAASETSNDSNYYDAGNDTTMDASTHTHGGLSTSDAVVASNDPAYRTLELIRSTDLNPTIPQNAIGMFDTTSLPNSDWTIYSAMDGKFLKGGASTSDGSSDTHTHGVTGTTNSASGTVAVENTLSTIAGPPLAHTHSCSATTPGADIKPPYYNVVFAYVNNASGTFVPTGLISMFDDTAPTNWTRVTDLDNYFIRGSSSTYGLGSSTTHTTHSNLTLNCTATTANTNYDTNPAQGGSTPSHTHTMGVSFGTATTTALPIYLDTVFAKRDNVITVSGYIRLSDESTADTTESGTLMNITVEGGSTYTPALDANGFYTQSVATPTSGNAILVFVNDGGDYEGSAVTVSGGVDISLDLYEDRFIARSDKTATSIVLQDIVDVNTTDADDLVPTVTIGGITIASGKELHINTSDTFDPGGTITTQTAGNLHLDDSSVMYLDTATNTIAGDITIDTSANLHIDTNTTVSGGDITATGTLSSSAGTVTMGTSGTISGAGTITFTDLAVSDTFTTTIGSSITVSGGDMTSTGTSAYSYTGTPTVTINGTGNLGGGGTTSLYNLVIGDGNNVQTTTVASTLTVNNDLNIYATETLAMGTNNVTVGSASISGSGDITINGSTSQSSGTLTILSNTSDAVLTGSGTLTAYNLTIGNGTNTVSVDAETNDVAINLGGTFTNTASATFKASSTASFEISGSFVNSATGTFTANSGTVTLDGTTGTPTITSGGDAFNDLSIDNAGTTLTWTLSDALDVNDDLLIDTANTLSSGTNYAVNIAGDLTVNGTYTANSNTTTLDGAGGTTQAVTGTISFYNLSITTSSTRTVTFGAGQTFTIASGGNLTLTGTSCTAALIIKSSSAGSAFTFANNDATPTVSYTEFTDTTITTNLISSGTGLIDGGGNTGITFDGTCIGFSSSENATAYSFQRKTFYDSTNSVYWMLYYDGTQIKTKYSSDGTTWTLEDPLTYATNDFSVWYQNIGSTNYVFAAIANGDDIIVRRGTLTSAPAITWDANTETVFNGTSTSDTYANAFISADATGHLWVLARHWDGTNYQINVIDSSSLGSGTWGSLTWNSKTTVSGNNVNSNVYGNIVPVAGDDMYAAFTVNTVLQGCLWDDDSGGTGAWLDSGGASCSYSLDAANTFYFNTEAADNLLDGSPTATKSASLTFGASTQTISLDASTDSFYILTDAANKKWTSDRALTTSTTGEKRNLDMIVESDGETIAVWEDSRNSATGTNTWTVAAGMNTIRQYHTSTLLPNGKVLMAGGQSSIGTYISHSEIYDPSSNSWSVAAGMNTIKTNHTATLLPNGKVLVAGGYSGNFLSHSEIYDPSANTWSVVAGMNAIRQDHTSTLLPDGKVLVAGGQSGISTYISHSEIYNPSANTWSVAAGMNTIKTNHTATLLPNGKVLVAGGYNGSYLSQSEIYDPAANTWSIAAGMNTTRDRHTATLLPNGKVLVAGGYSGAYLSHSEIYDPSANTWSIAAAMNTERYSHTATLLANGKILVAGGYSGAYLSHSEIYDPSANTWSVSVGLNTIRNNHTATLLANGKVLVAGGYNGGELSHSELYTPATFDIFAQKYDSAGAPQWPSAGSPADIKVNSDDGARSTASGNPSLFDHTAPAIATDSAGNAVVTWSQGTTNVYGADIFAQKLQGTNGAKLWPSSSTNTWTATAGMNTIREYHTATLLSNGKVLVAGGQSGTTTFISHSEIYDPSANTWSVAAGMNTIRYYHTTTLLPNGKVLVAGGYSSTYLSDSEIYEPSANTWSVAAGMNTVRITHTATLLPNGKVLVAGGKNASFLSHSEIYDSSANSWSIAAGMNTIRQLHTATLLPNGKVFVAGGFDGINYLSHSEIYDPSNNSWSVAAAMNTIRYNHTATLLANGKVLVAGGSNGSVLSQSEIYDPSTNSWTIAAGMNTLRYNHTATLLANGKVLVAGGYGSAYLSHSEIYDPSTNSWSVAAGMNTIRRSHTATLLTNGKVLVAGGLNSTTVYLSHSELYTPAGDIRVSSDGSAGNWDGFGNPYYPETKGLVGAQTNPAVAVDSSSDAIIVWEDDRYNNITQNQVSFDYGTSPATPPVYSRNLAGIGVGNGGGGTRNSDGDVQAILGTPKRIMGQKLSSATGAKNWGNNQSDVNQNNPWDTGMSTTGDANTNPAITADGTNIILAWEANPAEKSENGVLKRESNIYTQKFDGSASSPQAKWGNAWTITAGLNTVRYNHTATLLANGKVLVAGGYNGSYLSHSEIYDPSANTWSVAAGMIMTRVENTATLLSNGKVFVAGGESGMASISHSEIYDPSANTWSVTAGMNTIRSNHTTTLLPNGRVLVVGGYGTTGTYLSHSEIYDPSANTWSVTAGMNTIRRMHTATLLPNGKVLVAGGESDTNISLSHSEIYDAAANTWNVTAKMAISRHYHTATLLPNGKVLVAGGIKNTSPLSHSEIYDPAVNTWSVAAGMNTVRYKYTATLLANGKVLVAGGYGSTSSLSHSEIYDPSLNSWSVAAGMNTVRREHTATLLGNGKVLVVGGYGSTNLSHSELYSIDQMVNSGSDLADQGSPDVKLSGTSLFYAWSGVRGSDAGGSTSGGSNKGGLSTQIFGQKTDNPTSGTLTNAWPDGTAGVWSATGNMITNRSSHTATLLANGKVLVAGGYGGSYLSHSEIYDSSSNSWSVAAGMNTVRYSHTATLLGNGKVLVAGGFSGPSYLSQSEIYDPSTNSWSIAAGMNTIRYLHTATLLPNGKVLVAGGAPSGVSSLSHSEIYDPAVNTWSVSAGMNTIRRGHTATLLGNGKVLVAGGIGGLYLSQSEIYDPSANSWSVAAGMNTVRSYHTATLLSNGKILMAGGYDGSSYLSHSEIYDPSANTWSVVAGMNTVRYYHTATLLSNGKVLMAGGYDGSSYLSHSEIYDPSANTWSVAAGMNTIRRSHTATLLSNGKVLVAGGAPSDVSSLSHSELFTPSGEMLLSHDSALSADKLYPKIALDSGNPVIAWADKRANTGNFSGSSLSTDWNVYMQKFDATTGSSLWPAGATTGGYTSPYSVMDIRVDTTAGSYGTHYSGRPAVGITDTLGTSKRVVVGFEDNRNVSSATSGQCGYSNSSGDVRICAQSYDIAEKNIEQDLGWYVYFYAQNESTPSINVAVATAEHDGFQLTDLSNSQSWTGCTGDCSVTPEEQTITFASGGTYPPPSDTVGNMTFRRYLVKFTRVSGSVDVKYDNTGVDSRLAIQTLTEPSTDAIDTVPAGFSTNLSAVADNTDYDVHLLYVDNETTDQISYKRWDSASLAWDTSPAGIATYSATPNTYVYPSLSIESASDDLVAFFVDSGQNTIEYRHCDRSEAISTCSNSDDWDTNVGAGVNWQIGSTFTNLTSGYFGTCEVFSLWSVGTGNVTIDWDKELLGGGGAAYLVQNDFEWFADGASTTLTDAWPTGDVDIGENTALTQIPATYQPLGQGEKVRIQMNFLVQAGACGGDLSASLQRFQLQYAQSESCTTADNWERIGNVGEDRAWRLYDNTTIATSSADVRQISTSTSGAEGLYTEGIPSPLNPNAVATSQMSEWDWPVEYNSASENTSYCFRMVKDDGSLNATAFDAYNSDSYPFLTTDPGTEPLMKHGKFFQNNTLRGFYWAD